jgi:hypothetical protein
MKNIILLTFLSLLALIVSCSKIPYYDIPTVDGKIIIYELTTSTNTGITTLDPSITFTVNFKTARSGDEIDIQLLSQQVPAEGQIAQWLPLAGTQKTQTLGADLKADITYTRAETGMNKAGDTRKLCISSIMDSHLKVFNMTLATNVTNPQAGTVAKPVDVTITRTTDTAHFRVSVVPMSGPYTGTIIAQRKNGINDSWVDAGASPFTAPAEVPISGNDFAAGKDTMYYKFTTTQSGYTDVIEKTVVIAVPFFYKKRPVTLILGGAKAGVNMLNNATIKADSSDAMLALDAGVLILHGGSAWAVGGKSIEFVESTPATYALNNVNVAVAEYEAGTPSATADPAVGQGVYIFKMINGPTADDVFYGMIKVLNTVPGVSVGIEYRIGDRYAHAAILK